MPLKVLTVDDSKTIRMIVKKAFKPFDCEMHEAENGVEGLACASKIRPDLIILDITMPVMNGIEMLAKLKGEAALKTIPIIMLTAESGKDNVMQIMKLGVRDYMIKPFKGEQLIERAKGVVKLAPSLEIQSAQNAGKYFSIDGDIGFITFPDKVNRLIAAEIEGGLSQKLGEMAGGGTRKFILDLGGVSEINVVLIKLVILVIESARKMGIRCRLVGTPALKNELKEFRETNEIPVEGTIADAQAAFGA